MVGLFYPFAKFKKNPFNSLNLRTVFFSCFFDFVRFLHYEGFNGRGLKGKGLSTNVANGTNKREIE